MDFGKMNPFTSGMKFIENIQKNLPKGIPGMPKDLMKNIPKPQDLMKGFPMPKNLMEGLPIPKDLMKGLPIPKNLNFFSGLGGNGQTFVNEVESATLEHLRLAVQQTMKIQDIMTRTTKNLMRTYAPDFVYPFYERVDDMLKPYSGENLQKTLTTQYESAYSWIKSMAPEPSHPVIDRVDKWLAPFKYEF